MNQTSVLHEVVATATNLAPSTRTKYLRGLNAWIEYAGNDPQHWTRRRAQNFYAGLLERMKPQSANSLMTAVQYAAKWWSIQSDNPALNFAVVQTTGTSGKADKQSLTADQARALLLPALTSDPVNLRDLAMIVVGLETGMRRMSLRSMTFEQTFVMGDAKTGYPTTRVLMKGHGTDRVIVPLSDTALTVLGRWLNYLRENGVTHGPIFRGLARKVDRQGRIVHVPGTTPIGESSIHKIVAERGKKAGIHVSPHVFRHTYVTWRLAAGFLPHQVAAMTAHTLQELGALGGYIDPIAVGAEMRNSTPEWLANLVRTRS